MVKGDIKKYGVEYNLYYWWVAPINAGIESRHPVHYS